MRRVSALALAAVLLTALALAQESWLDPIRALDGQGRTRQALGRLESDPTRLAADTDARLLHGVLLAKLGRTAEARQLYQRLILERPDLPEAYNNLAVMHAAAGDYDAAIEILKQGLATHPSYRTTYDNLTKVYGKLAGDAYSKALGDERVDAEPLRLALINGLAQSPVAAASPAPPPPRQPTTRPQPVREPLVEAPEAGPLVPAPQPPQLAQPEPAPAAPAPAVEAGAADEQEIWRTVQAWADAWSGQQTDVYLSYYAADFVPPEGGPRLEWEALRRRRLTAPSYIRISLALLEVERLATDRAVARFVQSYESDRYSDVVTKALELSSTESGWRIVDERLEEEPPG